MQMILQFDTRHDDAAVLRCSRRRRFGDRVVLRTYASSGAFPVEIGRP